MEEICALLILNLGTRQRCVISATLRPLYPSNKTCYPTSRGASDSVVVNALRY